MWQGPLIERLEDVVAQSLDLTSPRGWEIECDDEIHFSYIFPDRVCLMQSEFSINPNTCCDTHPHPLQSFVDGSKIRYCRRASHAHRVGL